MRKGLAVTLSAASLVIAGNLAAAAPLPMALPPPHAAGTVSALPGSQNLSSQGIRPAVLEIAIPNSVHRALAHPAGPNELSGATAPQTVQWLTGPVPSRCQHESSTASAGHACLVI